MEDDIRKTLADIPVQLHGLSNRILHLDEAVTKLEKAVQEDMKEIREKIDELVDRPIKVEQIDSFKEEVAKIADDRIKEDKESRAQSKKKAQELARSLSDRP